MLFDAPNCAHIFDGGIHGQSSLRSNGVQSSLLISILLGAALLLAGRQLFWLFVAAVGFLYGLEFAPSLFQGSSEVLQLVIALACGLIGALLGIFAQKVAVALAGGLTGGYLAAEFAYGAAWHEHFPVIAFAIGAIIGAALVLMIFDWALIICSSLAGSALIVPAFHLHQTEGHLLFAVLAVVGILIQAGLMHRRRVVPVTAE